MIRRSPHTILYADLLALAEEVLQQRTSWYNGAVGRGVTDLDFFVKKVNAAKVLVKMLKKGLPGKQIDFLELFKAVSK